MKRTRLLGLRMQRVAAGALSLVLVASIVISALLLGLVFLNANQQALLTLQQRRAQVRRNVRSGLALLQAHRQLGFFQPLVVDLYDNGTDSVQVVKKPWGVFEVATAQANTGQVRDTITALLGTGFGSFGQAALYLSDETKPLTLVGSSQVAGDCYLPNAGFRTGFLSHVEDAPPQQAVTGKIMTSGAELPLTAAAHLRRVSEYAALKLDSLLPPGTRTTVVLSSASRSFRAGPLVCYRAEPFMVKHAALSGQIVLISTRKIVLAADTQLDHVLVIAPTIIIEQGFKGRLQAFARDTLEVQSDCQLLYPSAVCVANRAAPTYLVLGERTVVHGIIIGTGFPIGQAKVLMHETTHVEGQVYTDGMVENCGQIRGSIMCRRLIYSNPATFYENYLVNAAIRPASRPVDFLSSPLLNPGADKGVVAWLQ